MNANSSERGSGDAVLLLFLAMVALYGWHIYQQAMLQYDEERFLTFVRREEVRGWAFYQEVWPMPLPPRSDYGGEVQKFFSYAECSLRRFLPAVPLEGVPPCP